MTENRCNTVLVAYSSLRKILKDYDCAFKSRLQSSFMSIHLRCGVPTETLIGEMLEINRKKLLLLILKDTVETALDSIPSPYKDILCLRFLKGMTFQEISELQDISLRTAFRRFDKARDVFGAALAKLGLTEKIFAERYMSDPTIAAACSRLSDETYFTAKSVRDR